MERRRHHEALIAVGSNIEPERNVARAIELVRERFELRATSGVYRTEAVGGRGPQPDFLNLVLRIRTDCPPRALREACRRLEARAGRRRTSDRYAPRTLDLDLLLLDDRVEDHGDWRLPDPALLAHAFVLVPAAEVAPDWVHPEAGRALARLSAEFPAEERAALRPWPTPRSAARSQRGPAGRSVADG